MATSKYEKLKRDAQTHIVDEMQANDCVIYVTVRGYKSTFLSFTGGGWPPTIQTPMFPPSLWPCDMHHFKTKTI